VSIVADGSGRAIKYSDRVKKSAIQLTWSRFAKIVGAFALVCIGTYAVMSDQVAIATDNAVVSAYAVTLRTPIDGVVSGEILRIGQTVQRGVVVARVENARVDDQHLVDLREHLTRARAALDATTAEIESLEGLRDELKGRASAYVFAVSARLAGAREEAENTLAAAIAKRELTERSLARRSTLAKGGFASIADLDKANSDVEIAYREVDAQQGRVNSIRAQIEAAARGIISEAGLSDVAYSSQRADEISVRIGGLKRERALGQADIVETLARLASEEARTSKLGVASLTTPASGMVWKLNASDGERIGTGDSVAQIVDCKAAFIIASVPQNRVPDIEVGSDAEYRLSGDGEKRRGRVVSVTGDATGSDRNLAAMPFEQKGAATATVRIALDLSKNECLVGRTARVLIPSSGHSVARILNRFF
jgi:multidrug resistance efflux pump